jgi:hypothetical protein
MFAPYRCPAESGSRSRLDDLLAKIMEENGVEIMKRGYVCVQLDPNMLVSV